MAEMAESGGGHKEGKKRAKKSSTRVDMTPMVDLAFLLLTFFVLTSTFSKPRVLEVQYPAKTDEDKQDKVTNGITLLLSKDKIFYYKGQFYSETDPGPNGATELIETNLSADGLRKLFAEQNAWAIRRVEELKKQRQANQISQAVFKQWVDSVTTKPKQALKVLVKTDDKATCKNFVDVFDEANIANVGVIMPMELMPEELKLLKQKIK